MSHASDELEYSPGDQTGRRPHASVGGDAMMAATMATMGRWGESRRGAE